MPRTDLNETFIRTANPQPGKQLEFYDEEQQGLMLRVSPGGSKTFAIYWYPPRPRGAATTTIKTKKIGEWTPNAGARMKLSEARTLAAEIIDKGPDAYFKDKSAAEAMTFGVVAEEFLDQYVDRRGLRTAKEIRRYVTDYLIYTSKRRTRGQRVNEKDRMPLLRDRVFHQIDRRDITRLLQGMVEAGHTPRFADSVLAVARKLFAWAELRGVDGVPDYKTPLARGFRLTDPVQRDRVLDDDELRAFWHACGELGAYGSLCRLLLLTSQRREKVTTMRWSDLKDGAWVIATERREKGNGGTLKLPSMAMKEIESRPEIHGNPYIFAADRAATHFNNFSEAKRQLDEIMLGYLREHVRPDWKWVEWRHHDLRRTAYSLMARAGVPPHELQQTAGHKLAGVAQIYNRYNYSPEKARALEALAALLAGILDPAPANVVAVDFARKGQSTLDRAATQ